MLLFSYFHIQLRRVCGYGADVKILHIRTVQTVIVCNIDGGAFNLFPGMNSGKEFFCLSVIWRTLIEREAVSCKPFPAFLRRRGFVTGLGKSVSPVPIFIKMPQERREIDVLCRVSGIADFCRYDDERSFRTFCLPTGLQKRAKIPYISCILP